MSDIIQLLPDSVANQIAAGEVIQRPASVVKELVENALDADAKNIHVLITDAGKTSIQIIDDGKGMSETDARLAFERHATSKIRQASDLFALKTMGFRGEALASIAAVAQVEMKTRQYASELGTQIFISGSKVERQEVIACSPGTNFTISNLFFNIPARRKFLKANSTELSNIITEFERIALVHPEVAFTLHSNDTELFNLQSSQIRQRILSIFGKKLNQQLLNVEVTTSMVKLYGYVAKPETARKKGAHQYFFVNGRFMKHPYFHRAVMEAYDKLIPTGEQVSYFLYFEIDPANIDVNIHPMKTEIKFENEQAIWQIVAAAVKESLGKFNAIPTIDFDTDDKPEIPAYTPAFSSAPPQTNYNVDFNPFKEAAPAISQATIVESKANAMHSGAKTTSNYSRSSAMTDWEDLYSGLPKASKMNVNPIEADFADGFETDNSIIEIAPQQETVVATFYGENQFTENSGQHLQFKGRFILTSVKSGLMLIDQHRAHIRVLFDRYMLQIGQRQGVSQGMLFPDIFQVAPSQIPILENIMDDLNGVGFELSDLGGGSYAVNGVPSELEGVNYIDLLTQMLHAAIEKGGQVKEEVQEQVALTMAKASAIVYGQILTNDEMTDLVDNLFACAYPNYTPDGKVVLATLKEDEIEKLFK